MSNSFISNTEDKTFWAKVAMVILAIAVSVGWYLFKPATEYTNQVVVAPVAAEVRLVPKIDTTIVSGKVAVYAGGAVVKKKLGLSKEVVENKSKAVIASSKIKASERDHTFTTTIDTDTGATETYIRTDPRPWVAYESRGEVGAYYGLKNNQPTIRIQARQDFIQVKALHLGVVGSVDVAQGKPDFFIGAGVSYKW